MAKRKSATTKQALVRRKQSLPAGPAVLLKDLRGLITEARERVSTAVHVVLVMLYWEIGNRVRTEVLKSSRATYGDEIVSTLSAQLGWSHFVEIIPQDDSLKRDFYAEMCRVERWSVRALRGKVQGLLFERTALSRTGTSITCPTRERPTHGTTR